MTMWLKQPGKCLGRKEKTQRSKFKKEEEEKNYLKNIESILKKYKIY